MPHDDLQDLTDVLELSGCNECGSKEKRKTRSGA
jgi:hypothetical protein